MRQKDAGDDKNRIFEQRVSMRENGNEKDTFTQPHEQTFVISRVHNEERVFDKSDTHMSD